MRPLCASAIVNRQFLTARQRSCRPSIVEVIHPLREYLMEGLEVLLQPPVQFIPVIPFQEITIAPDIDPALVFVCRVMPAQP